MAGQRYGAKGLSATAATRLAGVSAPPFAKDGRIDLIDIPIEKIVIAGPCVNLAAADLAAEAAGMLVGVMLTCRGVRQSAIGASKIFGRPYATCHAAIMRSIARAFQRGILP
jgi:hypothetical protein